MVGIVEAIGCGTMHRKMRSVEVLGMGLAVVLMIFVVCEIVIVSSLAPRMFRTQRTSQRKAANAVRLTWQRQRRGDQFVAADRPGQ